MINIAIITLNGYFNYGNRLQNYALQEALTLLGANIQTIRFIRGKRKDKYKTNLRKVKRWIKSPVEYSIEQQRHDIFMTFSQEYILETENIYYMDDDIAELNSKFDYFVVGSDQVWNPSMNKGSSFFFLDFADENKRIAYAPSFGISELPEENVSDYKKWIKEIPNLSVRENEGAKIIKDLTGREASVLVDPTILLSKKRWINIAKEANNKPNEAYLLTYFLGGIPNEYKKQINEIAKLKGLKIVNLGDINEKETYQTGPSEFIDYINDCSIFCTDSFHGVVFSILLEKPFIVYERVGTVSSMYSRIETLLSKFKLNERKSDKIEINEKIFNIDYTQTLPLLEREREQAFNFLRNSVAIGDAK